MQVFNVALVALVLPVPLIQQVVAAAVTAQQSTFRSAPKPALAAIQQSHTTDTSVTNGHQHKAVKEHGGNFKPYDTTHYMDGRSMTPVNYGTEMMPSWRDSDGIREATEHGSNHEAHHDRTLGRRGPRAWPYMDEVVSHFPDKSWVILGFLTGLFACLPCLCSTQGEDKQQGFNLGLVGLSIAGLCITIGILATKLGITEVFWRIHVLIWGYYWWTGLLLIPCTCLGVIGCITFCLPTICFKCYRTIFPPLSKDGGRGKDSDDLTENALGPRMKHFEQRHPGHSWSDLMPSATEFMHHEPQPRPSVGSDNVPHLALLPREPGDWDQFAAWTGSLSGT
jgi:hypothetical protein